MRNSTQRVAGFKLHRAVAGLRLRAYQTGIGVRGAEAQRESLRRMEVELGFEAIGIRGARIHDVVKQLRWHQLLHVAPVDMEYRAGPREHIAFECRFPA